MEGMGRRTGLGAGSLATVDHSLMRVSGRMTTGSSRGCLGLRARVGEKPLQHEVKGSPDLRPAPRMVRRRDVGCWRRGWRNMVWQQAVALPVGGCLQWHPSGHRLPSLYRGSSVAPRHVLTPDLNTHLWALALRRRLWLRADLKPIVAVVGRLDHQKGVELIAQAIPYCLDQGCQFVLLGSSPSPQIGQRFWQLKRVLNDNQDCHLELGYDEELAHLIYAGADLILVPSIYEPCGLTQMIAMRYGTVPVVRNTGGLADTVFDVDYANKPKRSRNGYMFNDSNLPGLQSALRRAIGLWFGHPDLFRELMANAMNCDYSWNHPAKHYSNIYHHIQEPESPSESADTNIRATTT